MNVVFDIGDVLLRWEPERYVRESFPALPTATVVDAVFRSSEWLALDQGTIERDEAEAAFVQRSGLSVDTVTALLDGMPGSLQPIAAMLALAQRQRQQGRAVYLLSNMPRYVALELQQRHAFLRNFTGALYSYEVRLLKPNAGIYAALLERYALSAADCVFIDDKPENLAAARQCGFATLHMDAPTEATAQSVAQQLEALLASRGAR